MAALSSKSLATAREHLKSHYSVVIVGSGYGGGVAAARLASTGESVCLLERGKEFLSGDFPDNENDALKEVQATLTQEEADAETLGSKSGLYQFHIDHDISVFRGCGLGGTSLIGAGVSIQADPVVFKEPCWPQALVDDLSDGLAEGFKRATQMLQPVEYPDDGAPLAKMQAHQRAAEVLGEPFIKLPINVQFKAITNDFGIHQDACKLCGNCTLGCNSGASNSVAMNYLPAAQQHGAEIFTEMDVRRVERTFDGRQWRVYYFPLTADKTLYDRADELFITTDCIVLSAGSIGTTEILLRSKNHGLSLSKQLGKSFSGNADLLGFGYNGDERINAVGHNQRNATDLDPVGPVVTSAIDARDKTKLQDQYLIEDSAMPGAFSNMYATVLAGAEPLIRKNSGTKGQGFLKEKWRKAESTFRGAHFGAVAHTQVFHVTGHDSSAGEIYLNNDQLQIEWPGVSAENVFEKFDNILTDLSEASGAVYIPNPPWNNHLNSRLMTFQPLGGCAMAEDASEGVTNHRGQVFADKQGSDIHVGLYVADGALMPMSLGSNPLLTITALAERNMLLVAAEYGWTISDEINHEKSENDQIDIDAVQPIQHSSFPTLNSTETIAGFWSPESGEDSDYEVAFHAGEDNQQAFELILNIDNSDVEGEATEILFTGSAWVPALSDDTLKLSQGIILPETDHPEKLPVTYRAIISNDLDEKWQFEGYSVDQEKTKNSPDQAENQIYFTIGKLQADAENKVSKFVGKGILSFNPDIA